MNRESRQRVHACYRNLASAPGDDRQGLPLRLGPGSRTRPLQQQDEAGAAVHEPQQDQHGLAG